MRAGHFVQQATGYVAFEPVPLPPDPPVVLDGELARLLSAADVALGRLDGITGILPNPELFVAMYVRQEAVLSSQIEGTQASLTDVLQFEAGERDGKLRDVEEVVNYVGAMSYGLQQTVLPLSLRLLREIHARLMKGVRGEHLEEKLGVSYVTANNHAARLAEIGVLRETTGYKRNRRFSFEPYLALFEIAAPPAPPVPDAAPGSP